MDRAPEEFHPNHESRPATNLFTLEHSEQSVNNSLLGEIGLPEPVEKTKASGLISLLRARSRLCPVNAEVLN